MADNPSIFVISDLHMGDGGPRDGSAIEAASSDRHRWALVDWTNGTRVKAGVRNWKQGHATTAPVCPSPSGRDRL